jgi:hypothetical protein
MKETKSKGMSKSFINTAGRIDPFLPVPIKEHFIHKALMVTTALNKLFSGNRSLMVVF